MVPKEQWDRFLENIKLGLTNKDALKGANIGEATFYKRMKKENEVEFRESVKRAQVDFKLKHLKNISKAGDTQWQASAWILERKFKEEFGKVDFTKDIEDEKLESEDELLAELAKLEEEDREHKKRTEEDIDSKETEEE